MRFFCKVSAVLIATFSGLIQCAAGNASPVENIEQLATKYGLNTVFEVPNTNFDCLSSEDYQALGPETALMRTINGVGCRAVINHWMGAEVSPDGLTWWFVAHGGHDAYGGNEAYRLDLKNDVPWSLHSLPSPRVASAVMGDGSVKFLEDVQWKGCPEAVQGMDKSLQMKQARACTKYGPGAIHTWSLPAYMNGKIYMRGWGSFGSKIHQGAWIFDPAKACIEADRARRVKGLARLNPQNVRSDCRPEEAWTYLGQRGPGIATPLPTQNLILYSWNSPEQGVLEDADGNVIRETGASLGTSAYGGVRSQWIPSLKLGVINKLGQRWKYVSENGVIQSPAGVESARAFARVDTSSAGKKILGHFSYDPISDDFLVLEKTSLFRISRRDLEDDDRAVLKNAVLDWSRIADPDPQPYNGFVYVPSVNAHCMMNRGEIGHQSLLCFRYEKPAKSDSTDPK